MINNFLWKSFNFKISVSSSKTMSCIIFDHCVIFHRWWDLNSGRKCCYCNFSRQKSARYEKFFLINWIPCFYDSMHHAFLTPADRVCDRYSMFYCAFSSFSFPSLIPLRQFSKPMTHETKVSISDLTYDLPVVVWPI